MSAVKAESVTATSRVDGRPLPGVRDVATGLVYPFMSAEVCASVAADVNAGKDDLTSYAAMVSPELYDIVTVQS